MRLVCLEASSRPLPRKDVLHLRTARPELRKFLASESRNRQRVHEPVTQEVFSLFE